ncbi:hypothetical protein N0V88_001253 [Collariella sp. IMI 366227]|nr:hypothetical protein N0V88_001253 [Collariella sp. IMI 366227]
MTKAVLLSPKSRTIEKRVKDILTHTPLIDGHNDLAIFIRVFYNNRIYNETFSKPFAEGGLPAHVDLPRLKAGMNGGAFWSHRPLHNFHNNGQLISPLGIEGLHQIGNSAATLRRYHALGVRYATLTHNCGNRFADAALWEGPLRKAPSVWGGLSGEEEAGEEMNRMGMVVDLAHTSVETMLDVLGQRENGWEEQGAHEVLDVVGRKGGLVMINFAPDFISCVEAPGREDGLPDFYPGNATLQQVVRHVRYIGERIGYEHVGLGSDFDGIESTPKGLEDVSKFPDLVTELLGQGVSDEDVAKIVGGNILRVWKEVEEVAKEMQEAGEPVLEDDLDNLLS